MTAAGSVAAVIVAAGRGLRAGGDLPKQWQRIAGRTVLEHTLARFRAHPAIDQIVLVVSADDMAHVEALGLADLCTLAPGGPSRAASVRSGLAQVAGAEKVLIHDAARCCLPAAVIDRVVAALDSQTAAAPALAVTDALWTGGGTVTGTTDRTGLWRAQTPQGFRLDAIRAAHAAFEGEAADDVEVARAAGIDVAIVAGDEDNLKITGPGDFARAARILEATLDIRTGTGYDVHRFGPGDHVMLCGVRVPHGRGLQGHSDADVGMHALTDAIYGALAEGDIGRHFPPSDPQWKGAESHIFLAHAARLARERGFAISNADVTLICEHPKIGPHAAAMRAALAQICGIEVGRVSVKATTSERLGFTGREEGIAAMAAVTLVSP